MHKRGSIPILSDIAMEIYSDVFSAMQPAEELGGPERAEYIALMTAIKLEAEKRIATYMGYAGPNMFLPLGKT